MKRTALIAVVAAGLWGCATQPYRPPSFSSPGVTFRHGTSVDPLSLKDDAQAYCRQAGLSAQYVRTVYPPASRREGASLEESGFPEYPYYLFDPAHNGTLLSQPGEHVEDAAAAGSTMPASYFKCG
jgi:hypothetical protein